MNASIMSNMFFGKCSFYDIFSIGFKSVFTNSKRFTGTFYGVNSSG